MDISNISIGYEQIGLQLMKSEFLCPKDIIYAKKSKKNVDFELSAAYVHFLQIFKIIPGVANLCYSFTMV